MLLVRCVFVVLDSIAVFTLGLLTCSWSFRNGVIPPEDAVRFDDIRRL